ncbi:MAG: metalloregulator ArsR/SmtB family transcription factor [Actinomycetota bacterium]
MIKREAKNALFDAFASIAKSLGSGRRVEILDLLANGERSVEGVAEGLGLSVANASQHLQKLRAAGLVESRREGTSILYRLASGEVVDFLRDLMTLAARQLPEIGDLAAAYLGDRGALEPLTAEQLARRLRERKDIVLLDVRPEVEFAAGHIPGAVSVPVGELGRRLQEIPKGRDVVAYCRGPYCAFAHEAVRILTRRGYRARRLEGGLPDWAAAGLPVDEGAPD